VAVITGASAGIGAAYADRLAKRGYDLILVARRGDRLDALARRLRAEQGVAVETIVADLANTADLDRVATVVAGDARVTMLVNNAGTATLTALANTGAADQDAMIALNVTALTRLSLAALRAFVDRDHGTIINIASVLSFHTLPVSGIYSGTKGFVTNFTRGLQEEVAGRNITVQLVLPATTRTDIWELGGFPLSRLQQESIMSAEDMVDAALAGLDNGETITFPSLEESGLWVDYDASRQKLFGATLRGTPASRYAAR
jgi:short-subunit dehydrogenase